MLWSLTNSLNLFFKEMYGDRSGEFVYRNWGFTPHSHPSLNMFQSCSLEHSFFFLKVLTVLLFELKYMKKIMVWTADKDMKVNMIFTVEWTTWAVEKEAEKNQAWLGIEPWPLTGRNALSTDLIKAAGEQAIVSSCHTRWWKLHELKYTKWIIFCTFYWWKGWCNYGIILRFCETAHLPLP